MKALSVRKERSDEEGAVRHPSQPTVRRILTDTAAAEELSNFDVRFVAPSLLPLEFGEALDLEWLRQQEFMPAAVVQPSLGRGCLQVGSHKCHGIQRIEEELIGIQRDPPSRCSVMPVGEDMFWWEAYIRGPPGSPYAAGTFILDIRFPSNYPIEKPSVRFSTRMYHCNVDETGNIGGGRVLKRLGLGLSWNPFVTISHVLVSIFALLADPDPYDAMVFDIAQTYMWNREAHDAAARLWASTCAN